MAYHLNNQGIIVFHRGRPTLGLPKNESGESDLNENGVALSMKESTIDADSDLIKNDSDEHRELEREKTYEEEDESEKRDRTRF